MEKNMSHRSNNAELHGKQMPSYRNVLSAANKIVDLFKSVRNIQLPIAM
jgi:hypothetical protein